MEKLTARQAAFVREYTKDHVGRAAAIRAGYSEKSANAIASVLLKKPHVRAAVEQREQDMADQLGMTQEWILSKLREVIIKATTPTPKLFQGAVVKAVIDGVEQLITEIDAGAALRGLETVMRHRGMLTERSEITVSGEIEYTLTLDTELKPTTTDPIEGEEETP